MRHINDQLKLAMGIEDKPNKQPKAKWNWAAIGTWSVIFYVGYKLVKALYNLTYA